LPPLQVDGPILCHENIVEDACAENLSVAPRMLSDMSNQVTHETADIENIFGDPVAYLAQFGIDAELVAEHTIPAAA
jgi:hypothetical protein